MEAIADQYNENDTNVNPEPPGEGDDYNVVESTEEYSGQPNVNNNDAEGDDGEGGNNDNYDNSQDAGNNDNYEQQQYNENDPFHQETTEEIVARTGYNFECTAGQRKYGGPPPNYDKSPPGPGTEVYVGKIPQDVMENELILLFEQVGSIYELRLMMNPQNSLNKGFCFITYCEKSEAQAAAETYNNYEIRPRKFIKVNVSIPNTRIYLGNLPKFKNKDQIFEEVSQYVEGLKDVIIYDMPDDPSKKNRGFAFLDFDSHKHASDAKKKLSSENMLVFNHTCVVDWADPQDEPNDEVMSKVKVLYIRNLKSNVLEQDLRTLFEPFGSLEKVKKIKDYAFIHYNEREAAMKALEQLNNTTIKDSTMNITLARPPIDPKVKEQRKMQHRMMATSISQGTFGVQPIMQPYPMPSRGGMMNRGGGMRGARGMSMRGNPMRGAMRGRGVSNSSMWGPGGQGMIRDHTKTVPYYDNDYNSYEEFGTNFDEYQNDCYDDGGAGDDQYYDDGNYDYNSFDSYQSFGQLPPIPPAIPQQKLPPLNRAGPANMRMKNQAQVRGGPIRPSSYVASGLMNRAPGSAGGGGGGGNMNMGRGGRGGNLGGGNRSGGAANMRGVPGGARGSAGGPQRGRGGKPGGPPNRGGRGSGGGGRGGGGGMSGPQGMAAMKRKSSEPPVFGMDHSANKQAKMQNAPQQQMQQQQQRPFGNPGAGNQKFKQGQQGGGKPGGGNRKPPPGNFQGGPQNKQRPPQQQQMGNKGKQQQQQQPLKPNSWQTQPIVQKPLSQMSGFGEQWF